MQSTHAIANHTPIGDHIPMLIHFGVHEAVFTATIPMVIGKREDRRKDKSDTRGKTGFSGRIAVSAYQKNARRMFLFP